jgi:probable HAF family extracellular repeat protein
MHDLAEAGPFNRAFGINNRGDVVGHWQFQSLLWRDGMLTALTGMITARGVNDREEVADALVLEGSSSFHPAIWRNGTVLDLTPTAGDALGIAWAINRRGVVVGEINGGAFRWENGVMTDLGTGFGLDVDRSGLLVVGESTAVSEDGFPRATLWNRTRTVNLGTLPGGGVSTAWGISDRGTFIAGFAFDAAGRATATLWTWR